MTAVDLQIHPSGGFDNAARAYDHIEVVPLAAAMGAEIRGVSIGELTDEAFKEIEAALFRHKMIFFRDQDISHADQEAFTLHFGEFGTDAYTKGTKEHPDIQPVVKEADARTHMIFGGSWHTDSPFLDCPPSVSLLWAKEVPPYGGDTMWANSALAYDVLSDVMKTMLAPLKVHMSAGNVLDEVSKHAMERHPSRLGSMEIKVDVDTMIDGAFHPLVRTHPVTKEKALYVDESYAMSIQGMAEFEAGPLLKFLRSHITQPAFTCRLRWEPHTLAVWDNRICLHHAFNDHDGHRREMYRTTVKGEVPA